MPVKQQLYVYYGYTKLTKKLIRKRELTILFENGRSNPDRNEAFVKRHLHLVHKRKQTEREMEEAEGQVRTFTKYAFLIDAKPYKGDIEKVLEQNYKDDRKNVSKEELELIREKLRKEFKLIF